MSMPAHATSIPLGRTSGARSRGIAHALIAGLFLVIVVLLFAVSSGLLWVLGINYSGITGSMASKIHPATYLDRLHIRAAGCRAAQSGLVLRLGDHAPPRHARVPARDRAARRLHRARRPPRHREHLRHLSHRHPGGADRRGARPARTCARGEADPRAARRERRGRAGRIRDRPPVLPLPLRGCWPSNGTSDPPGCSGIRSKTRR